MMDVLTRLLEISAYSAVLFLAIMAIKKALHYKLSPMLHYMIWFLLIARLCVPVTIDSAIKLIVIPEQASVAASQAQPEAALSEHNTPASTTFETPHNSGTQNSLPPEQNPTTLKTSAPTGANPDSRPIGSWTHILVAVWLTGVFISAAWLMFTLIKMNRMIMRLGTEPAFNIRKIIAECKNEWGIRKNLTVLLMPNISTPALTVGFAPKLILPEALAETFDDRKLEFALKHELTHYKRKDHLTGLLLRVLQAVYWFNPVVWLTGRFMLADMETACDSMVIKTLNSEGRTQYVLTLLDMFSSRKAPQYLLGMALNNTEKIAERRIRGAYMNRSSKRSAKLMAGALAIILIFGCFTTACQPTPKESVVVQKDSDNMLNMAQQSTTPADKEIAIKEAMSIPDRYTYEAQSESGLISLSADAQIKVPDAPSIPVMRAKMRGFTQEETDKLVKVLMRGEPIYTAPATVVYTKEQLNERIIEEKRILASGEYFGLTKEDIEKKISWYEERLPDAPETLEDADLTLSDGKLNLDEESGIEDYKNLAVLANLHEASFAILTINNIYADKHFEVYFSSGWNWDGQPKAAALALSEQEAQQKAEALLAELSRKDMSLVSCFKDSTTAPSHETWVLNYAPQIDGISVSTETDHSNAASSEESKEGQAYAPTWDAERLQITIDDEGVQDLQWCSPFDVAEEVTASATLKPFDEIKHRFEEMFFVKNVDSVLFDKGKTFDVRFIVSGVELTLMRVNEKDSPDTGLIVPVWFFHGYPTNELEAQGLTEVPDGWNPILMKINAIDGSIID